MTVCAGSLTIDGQPPIVGEFKDGKPPPNDDGSGCDIAEQLKQ